MSKIFEIDITKNGSFRDNINGIDPTNTDLPAIISDGVRYYTATAISPDLTYGGGYEIGRTMTIISYNESRYTGYHWNPIFGSNDSQLGLYINGTNSFIHRSGTFSDVGLAMKLPKSGFNVVAFVFNYDDHTCKAYLNGELKLSITNANLDKNALERNGVRIWGSTPLGSEKLSYLAVYNDEKDERFIQWETINILSAKSIKSITSFNFFDKKHQSPPTKYSEYDLVYNKESFDKTNVTNLGGDGDYNGTLDRIEGFSLRDKSFVFNQVGIQSPRIITNVISTPSVWTQHFRIKVPTLHTAYVNNRSTSLLWSASAGFGVRFPSTTIAFVPNTLQHYQSIVGRWATVTVTADGTEVKYYLDGKYIGNLIRTNTGCYKSLGDRNSENNNSLKAEYAEWCWIDRVISEDEIKLYHNKWTKPKLIEKWEYPTTNNELGGSWQGFTSGDVSIIKSDKSLTPSNIVGFRGIDKAYINLGRHYENETNWEFETIIKQNISAREDILGTYPGSPVSGFIIRIENINQLVIYMYGGSSVGINVSGLDFSIPTKVNVKLFNNGCELYINDELKGKDTNAYFAPTYLDWYLGALNNNGTPLWILNGYMSIARIYRLNSTGNRVASLMDLDFKQTSGMTAPNFASDAPIGSDGIIVQNSQKLNSWWSTGKEGLKYGTNLLKSNALTKYAINNNVKYGSFLIENIKAVTGNNFEYYFVSDRLDGDINGQLLGAPYVRINWEGKITIGLSRSSVLFVSEAILDATIFYDVLLQYEPDNTLTCYYRASGNNDWVVAPTLTGTNPMTLNTTIEQKWFVITNKQSGQYIGAVEIYDGNVIP